MFLPVYWMWLCLGERSQVECALKRFAVHIVYALSRIIPVSFSTTRCNAVDMAEDSPIPRRKLSFQETEGNIQCVIKSLEVVEFHTG